MGMPIAAGNLFIGSFDVGNALSNPLKATKFGLPFLYVPTYLAGYYKYKAGSQYTEGGKPVNGKRDICDIYAIMYETDDQVKTLDGTNVFTSSSLISITRITNAKETEEWTHFNIPFISQPGKVIDKNKLKAGKYNMEILGQGGEKISGVWTGGVKTKVSTLGLTIPLMITYKTGSRWNIKGGPYFSYLISKEFSGQVYEGYLREDKPIGPKVEFTDGKIATYDFSEDMRHFQWGLQFGAGWRAFKHLNIYVDLTWGLNNILKNDFHTITFAMHPIYLNVGFGYAF